MADRVLLGKNTNTGEVGLWVSKPGANVIHLAGNSYMESLGNWYGYQKEFDDSPETAWTFYTSGTGDDGMTDVGVNGYAYDPGDPVGHSNSLRWRWRSVSHATANTRVPQIKRSKNNTFLVSPTGYSTRLYTEDLFIQDTAPSSLSGLGYFAGPDSFSGTVHNVIEMKIRRNMNHPAPPPSNTSDFRFYFISTPVAGCPVTGGSTPLATFANNVVGSDGSVYGHPVFWARKNGGVTTQQKNNYSGFQFEYPTGVYADTYNTGGIWFVEAGVTSPDGTGQGIVYPTGKSSSAENKWDTLLPDGEWHILEWDMSEDKIWSDPYGHMEDWIETAKAYNADTSPTGIRRENPEVPYNEPHLNDGRRPYSSDYNISRLMFLPLSGITWNPDWAALDEDPANPPWLFEIDYVRVKKKGVPNDVGKYGSVKDSLVFSSDWQETGLVHQEGTVTIGTQKANIDGTTSPKSFDKADHTSTLSNGLITFPKLPYIPVVLFQRYDAASGGGETANSYPGGEQEFSIATTKWEDHLYPTISTDPRGVNKGWDINLKTASGVTAQPWWGTISQFLPSEFGGIGAPLEITDYSHYNQYADDGSEIFPSVTESLPWNDTPIPAPSYRAGNTFSSDHAFYFSEMRTFAYARAGKDRFYLTCRNAIAQEGTESLWNLSPTLPEAATANQGAAAFNSSSMRESYGNWGMFHPALILFNTDGTWKHFSEGLTLKPSVTDTNANTFLIDLEGTEAGTDYSQFKWWLNYSGYPFVYDGSIARPSDPIPTDKAAFKDRAANGSYYGDTGGFYPYRYHKLPSEVEFSGQLSLSQYSVKRLSSPGIFHPEGVVPKSSPAFNNRNAADGLTLHDPIYNQTSYIGGSGNKVSIGGAGDAFPTFDPANANPPVYKYWVLRIPASIQGYTPNESQGG